MTKPDPDLPDPETPDQDPADARSPGSDADAAEHSGATPPQESQPNEPGSPAADAPSDDDDAVWLDLVARLEGVGTVGDEATGGPAGSTGAGPSTGVGSGAGPSRARTFRDFDPLGLSGAAPIELSAKERLAPAPGRPAAGNNEIPDTEPGPRDYETDDDDGAFVPEEPPSLAGADPMTVLAWIGAVGGPIALVLSAMFWRSAPLVAILGMVAAFAAAVVFLIMKLPGEKDEHDDGARI
ncbi:hypothetical protein [Arthrobacter sp. ES3-54]|uniref:hypothetical protein n=1 Tax=Arthrobacter sp. ES3-54 TaxID=1502991 RepID=UPI0024049A9C|nr:hypothetical protein [Arthrobacter sp. ES3-54]MDF9751711.1 hypothetical protein [Arthrobacter sp. ES3-54]